QGYSGGGGRFDYAYFDDATLAQYAKQAVDQALLNLRASPAPAGTMTSSAVHFKPGDVLYGRLRPYLNKVYRPTFEGLCSAEFIVLPENERVDGAYLQYFLNSSAFVRYASHLNAGDRPRVDFDQLASYEMPLPEVDEQRRIVAEIEKQFSRLDEAVANLKRVKANLKRYKAAVLKAAVAGDLTPKTSTWQTVQLGTVAAVVDPQPSHRTPPVDPGGVPYVGLGDFRVDETIDLQNARKVSPSVLEEHRARYRLKVGDFVFGKIGTIGQPARLPTPFDYALSANLVLIQPDESRISSGFAFVVMASPQVSAASEEAKSATTQAAFGIKRIRQLTVDLPSIIEQRAIVAEVDRRLSLLAATEHQVERGLHRARSTRASLLSKAFGVAR
ncbi:MAG: restriction endonuclease subunit S, partial [Betaproteobacteria bacterium]